MDRRTFLGSPPALVAGVAGVALSTPALAKARESGEFRRISEEQFEFVYKNNDPGPVLVHHYVVASPYPVGSAEWLSVSMHIDGQVWVAAGPETLPITKPRRVIFPRVTEGPDGIIEYTDEGIDERIFRIYEAVCENGFDSVKPDATDWKVVWVEFLCVDGRREHIVAGLPVSWSSEIPLNVLVTQVIC